MFSRAVISLAVLLWAAAAGAASWKVDPAASRLAFSGVQADTPFQGQFAKFEATIDFDPAKPESGHALIMIDMASAATGDRQRDAALPESDWFDVKRFPQARFEATRFRALGGDRYEAVGSLSIRGVSKECVLPFTLTIAGDTAHAKGHLQLVRTDFGVGQGSWTSGQWVALQVGVDVDLSARRVSG